MNVGVCPEVAQSRLFVDIAGRVGPHRATFPSVNPEEKRKQLDRLNELVTDPLTVGGAETGLNLCDMYTHFENRDEVLTVLQQRFPQELGELDKFDPRPWFEKIASLHRPESYVSGYAGEVGEVKAIEALKPHGIDATQFESKKIMADLPCGEATKRRFHWVVQQVEQYRSRIPYPGTPAHQFLTESEMSYWARLKLTVRR